MSGLDISNEDIIDANIYVVCKIRWEYDDNSYCYAGGSTPQNAFTLLSLAQEFCRNKNCEWFIKLMKEPGWHHNPSHYTDYISDGDFLEVQAFLKEQNSKIRMEDYKFVCDDPNSLTYDDVHPIIEFANLQQYEVVAITLVA